MNIHSIRVRAVLPALSAAVLAASGPAAAEQGAPLQLAQLVPNPATTAARGKPFRVAPPPLPNAPTVVAPGEPPEEVTRNRHGHNELKVRGKVRLPTDKK